MLCWAMTASACLIQPSRLVPVAGVTAVVVVEEAGVAAAVEVELEVPVVAGALVAGAVVAAGFGVVAGRACFAVVWRWWWCHVGFACDSLSCLACRACSHLCESSSLPHWCVYVDCRATLVTDPLADDEPRSAALAVPAPTAPKVSAAAPTVTTAIAEFLVFRCVRGRACLAIADPILSDCLTRATRSAGAPQFRRHQVTSEASF